MTRKVLWALAATVALAACNGNDTGSIVVSNARVGQPTGPNAAFYFTATSDGGGDRLIGASTASAASVELHETTVSGDGTMGMQPVDGLDLPVEGDLVLEPGGHHFMLIDAERMDVGDTIEIVIYWEEAGDLTVEAEVVAPGDTMGHGDVSHGTSDG
jgi:copper(I)-binding protein